MLDPMTFGCGGVAALMMLLLVTGPANAGLDETTASLLSAAINGDHRSTENKARDVYRKPLETLSFLGLRADMTVVEIWPGGGWYSEILAPVLKDNGQFYAAHHNPNAPYGYQRRGLGAFLTKLGENPDLYSQVVITELTLPYGLRVAPRESADMVVTFRNVHNLVMELYGGGEYATLAFRAMFDALKPGGVLGVVDHRWDDPATEDPLAKNGYISKARTVALAESVGFELAGESHILSNASDTKDYESGVWTLPPSLALGDKDKDRYLAIGESDRFLLRFVKPTGNGSE
jgi:predicted methyltransferase